MPPSTSSKIIEIDDVTVIDLSTSPHYRRGHIPGAWFAIRGRLDRALPKIPLRPMVVLTSEDGVLASLAVDEARALTKTPVHWLKGGNAAWAAAGIPALDRRAKWPTSRSTSGSSPTSGRTTTRRR